MIEFRPPFSLHTVGDILNWATEQFENADLFYGHGTDNPWDEAVVLVLYALQLPIMVGREILTMPLSEAQQKQIIDLIHKRITLRIPAPYLTHEAWFAGLPFYVDESVIIPRSPIAELIEHQFSPWIAAEKIHHILDLCTGSGCIAVACALQFPAAKVDAVDISDDALTVAAVNVQRHGVDNQVKLVKSDLFIALNGKKYDVIVTNPPYVDQEEMAALPREYHHEPSLALAAGAEGLDFAVQILREAAGHLTDHGILIVEVGNSEGAMRSRFPQVPLTWLEFEHGGGGVFLLTKEQLKQ